MILRVIFARHACLGFCAVQAHNLRGEVLLSRTVSPSTARRRMILSSRCLLIEHGFPYNSIPYLVTSH